MMNTKQLATILVAIVIIAGFSAISWYIFNNDDEPDLVIYTYDSLLADPGFDFARAFEVHAGLENGSVQVVLLDDAGSIVNRAVAEKDSPGADVLIGIDNVLVEKAREANILEKYQPEGSDLIIDGLVEGLASDYLLTPYDYGTISLWYLKDRLRGSIDADAFVLEDLLEENLANQTIVLNPMLSSPGLGFLLHTIAIYGDDDIGIDGVIDGDWEAYWANLAEDVRIANSWGEAWQLFDTKEEGRPMMVSYTTSPAYGNCLYDDNGTEAVLSNENGTKWGWQQIEGIGLVKNAAHPDLAKDFIDWFISEELQSQIHLNQWMNPAIEIAKPGCYSIVPEGITPLNPYLPPSVIATNLDSWLLRWEEAVAL